MSSDRKIQSARANGAKSRGTKTPDGLAASARNAVTHGLAGRVIVLSAESALRFDAIREAYLEKFNPQNRDETGLVDQMVAARWRLERTWAVESAALELKMAEQEPDIHRDLGMIHVGGPIAAAFKSLADGSNVLQLIGRYEARHQRAYSRALRTLLQLRAAAKSPKEPNPIPVNGRGQVVPISRCWPTIYRIHRAISEAR